MPQETRRRAIKVLLVDDDQDDYMLTRDALKKAAGVRFELDWCPTYDKGLAEMIHNRHEAYLVDYQLGARDGVELIKAAVEKGCKKPQIILTGQGDLKVDVLAMRAGAVGYLEKSAIRPQLLERTIRWGIERHRADRLRRQLSAAEHLQNFNQFASSLTHQIRNPAAYMMTNLSVMKDHVADLHAAVDALRLCVNEDDHDRVRELLARDYFDKTFAVMDEMLSDNLDGQKRIKNPRRSGRPGTHRAGRHQHGGAGRPGPLGVRHDGKGDPQAGHAEEGPAPDAPHLLRPRQAAQGHRQPAAQRGPVHGRGRSHRQPDQGLHLQQGRAGDGHSPGQRPRHPREIHDSIMEPFFTTRHPDGKGLGLSIATEVARRHGGIIRFDSKEGQGSVFQLSLPEDTGLAVSRPVTPGRPVAEVKPAEPKDLSRARVLVIAHEQALQSALQRLLAPHHEVMIAAGGKAGLAVIKRDQAFDVVISELTMPAIDGEMVYEYIQNVAPKLLSNIILLVDDMSTAQLGRFMPSMSDRMLVKPVQGDTMLN